MPEDTPINNFWTAVGLAQENRIRGANIGPRPRVVPGQRVPVPGNPMDGIIFDEIIQAEINRAGAAFTQTVEKVDMDKESPVITNYGVRVPAEILKVAAQHDNRVYGVELEIENFSTHLDEAKAAGFTFTTDGSLRNNGIEAISKPNSVIGTVKNTVALWEKYKITEKNFSDRTSIHVHANVLDFTNSNLKSLALVYQVIEELLFKFVGNERDDNIFCVPWYDAGVTVKTFRNMMRRVPNWAKYTALNLAPVAKQGTVEFRHMHGHCDIGLFTTWLTIIDELMNFAKKIDYQSIEDTICKLNTSSEYRQFLHMILPSTYTELIARVPDWESKLSRGVVEAKLLAV